MKKKIAIVFFLSCIVVSVIILLSAVTSGRSATNQTGKIIVSASFYPLYFITKEIGGDVIDIENITPAGAEPHEYEPSIGDMRRIEKSNIVVSLGSGFEPWFEKTSRDLESRGIRIIRASDTTPEIRSGDPHMWLDPILAQQLVDSIAKGLSEGDTVHRIVYEQNATKLKNKLQDLDNKLRTGLSICEKRTFVSSHTAFGYFAKRYNLTQISISGINPESEPSPKEISNIVSLVRKENLRYIFFETLVNPKLSETIAREIGASTLVLNPIEGLTPEDIASGKEYFGIMEENLHNLQEALICQTN